MKVQRAVSFFCALLGVIILSPVFLILCIWIIADSGFPVLFRQKRVARSEADGTYRYFTIYKFRTMYTDTPKDMPTHMLENPDAFITKAGHFLRKTSLDELPQLFNVLKGDMNLVGPRPALYNQEDLMAERDKYGANFVRPGITGLAQVMGRDELPIDVKARYDGIYTQYVGPVVDLYSLIRTIAVVATSDGVVEGGTGALEEKKKKILIITNHSYMLYQFRKELIEKLMDEYDVVLSMPFVGHEDDFATMGCKCVETDVDRRGINPVTDFKLLQFYNRIISDEKPDKVITYSIKPNIYAGLVCRHRKIPYYANVQGMGTAFQKKLLAKFVGILYKTAFRKVSAVFFENKGNAQEFINRKLVAQDKIVVLNGAGVNLEHYTYTPLSLRQEGEESKGSGDGKMHFLYLGRIMKEKGIDELFTAMRMLYSEYGDKVVLDIVGFFEDEYRDTVEKMVEDGIAVFHGFQEETRPYYAMADCVVLPSYHEGMSNVLLEASAMGRPVITSAIPGCREAVEDGKSGYLCEVKNADMLFEKMKLMADKNEEEIEEMGRYARERMEKLFDKKKIVESTFEIISRG
ncbi:MAG TPA: sugar transferase [Candidatus Mediterraneibacter merdigallinarum]|nr:sugar transferase [Candidatus Mediterraneibacter merdigallinarum]